MEANIISKEQLKTCSFYPVSKNDEISAQLNKAMILGNNFKSKCKIYFNTQEGINVVETTVWSVSENHVILKGDIFIPINAILSVDI